MMRWLFIPKLPQRMKSYLDAALDATDLDGPLFRPLSHHRKMQEPRRPCTRNAIDRVLRTHAKSICIESGYSAHCMRTTFITTTLKSGCSLEDVQRAAGHSEPAPYALRPPG